MSGLVPTHPRACKTLGVVAGAVLCPCTASREIAATHVLTWRIEAAVLQAQHEARLTAHEVVHHVARRGVVAPCTGIVALLILLACLWACSQHQLGPVPYRNGGKVRGSTSSSSFQRAASCMFCVNIEGQITPYLTK